jgi:predicted metal-dependent peptidase
MTAQDWQIAVEQAVKVAMAAGKLPAGVASAVIKARASQVDWTSELREFVVHNIPSGQSWATPNRRFVASGLYLPGTIKENVGEIVLAVDTSGSTMWMQKQFATEFGNILREVRPEKLWIVYCDAAVQDVTEASPEDFDHLEFKPKGFGGTMFQPVFDWVDKQGIDPLALIYLTDGMCSDRPEAPPYPVLWCMSLHCDSSLLKFGDVLRIPIEYTGSSGS